MAMDKATVVRLSLDDLATLCSTPYDTARIKLVPAMEDDGVLNQRGRFWYGRVADVEAWLLGRWDARARAAT